MTHNRDQLMREAGPPRRGLVLGAGLSSVSYPGRANGGVNKRTRRLPNAGRCESAGVDRVGPAETWLERVAWLRAILQAVATGTRPDQVELAKGMDELPAELDAALATVRPSLCVELCASLLELYELSNALLAERLARHLDGLAQVRDAVARLRSIEDSAAMMRAASGELCDACGFARAMVTWLDRSAVVVRSVHIASGPGLAARALEFGNTNCLCLDQLPIEAEMIRRRAPILVAEAPVEQRTQPPFVALLNASAYVAAPIFRGRAAIGFLHADLYDSGRAPDAIDRDRLGAFAEGLGCAIEAAILYERLRAGRDLAASLWRSTDAVLADPEVGVEPITQRGNLAMAEAGEPRWSQATTGSPIMGLLTKRERRVLALMVQGATNATIGEELVISRGTVKSHVASILRKLGAANRADAVARYFQAVQVS